MNGDIPWTALDDYADRHLQFSEDFPFFEAVIDGFERINRTLFKMRREAAEQQPPEEPETQHQPRKPGVRRRRRL